MQPELFLLENYIQMHTHKMLNTDKWTVKRAAANQVAIHASQWLNKVDKNHPRWSEILDLLCIALKIISDDDGGSSLPPDNSPFPVGPYQTMQPEWAEILQKNLTEVLYVLVPDRFIPEKKSPVSNENCWAESQPALKVSSM